MRTTSLVSACVLSLLVALPASGQVLPAGRDTVAGSSNIGVLVGLHRPTRIQQVYSGAAVGTGTILGLRLRQDEVMAVHSGTCTWVNALVIVSSTAKAVDSLGSDFASNHGNDLLTVFDGDLSITALDTSSDPRPFEILIPFTTSFPFDSSGGLNLLVDITAPEQETEAPCGGMPVLDSHTAAGDSISSALCWGAGDWSCSATFDTAKSMGTAGLVTLILKPLIFADGFESSDTSAWTVPLR